MTWNFSNVTGQNNNSEFITESGGNVYVYNIPYRGPLSSIKLKTSLDTLSSNILSQWNLWNSITKPLFNSLPAGARDKRWDLNSKTDALIYGIQGSTLMVNNDATSTSSSGKYWDSDNLRPKTIAEVFEDVFDTLSGITSIGGSGGGGLTDYAYLPGISGGQTLYGGIDSGDDLSLFSTSNATKGSVFIGSTNSFFDGTGKLSISIPDAANSTAVEITQNDISNHSIALKITNNAISGIPGVGSSIFLTGNQEQIIRSDENLFIGVDGAKRLTLGALNFSIDDGNPTEIYITALDLSSSTETTTIAMSADSSNGDSEIYISAKTLIEIGDGSFTPEIHFPCGSLTFHDNNLDSSTWTPGTDLYLSYSAAEFNTYISNYGEVSLINAINQAAAGGGGVTLDGAYDEGGAGVGKSIIVDSGAVTLTVPDTSNNPALSIANNDATNDPNAVLITNSTSGYSVFLTGSGFAQSIWSDQPLTIGSSGSPDGLNIHSIVTGGDAAIEILASSDNVAEVSVSSLSSADTASVSISASGVSNIAPCYVDIAASNSGTDTSYVKIGGTLTDDIRFVDANLSGSSWVQSHLLVSSAPAELDTFKTNFGEVSIVNAVNQAYSVVPSLTVQDWGYLDTIGPTGSGGPTLVYQLDGTPSQLVERMGTGIDLTAGVSPHVFVSNVPLSSLGNTLANSGSSYDSSGSLFTTALTNAERPTGAVTCEFIGTVYEWTTYASLFSIRDGSSSADGCSLINLCCKNGYGAMQLFIEYNSSGTDERETLDWIAPIGTPMYIALTRDSSGLVYNLYVNGLHIDSITFVNTPYLSATPSQQLGLLCEYKYSSLRDNDIGGAVSSFRMTVGEEFSQAQVTEVWNSIKPVIA